MKYMGSKRRIAKDILPIILKDRKEDQWYVEPFVGGANITIMAVIWFILFTCIGNYECFKEAMQGNSVHLKTIPVIIDVMATAWIIKMIF